MSYEGPETYCWLIPELPKVEHCIDAGLPKMVAIHIQPPLPVAKNADPYLSDVAPIGDNGDVACLTVVEERIM